MILLLGFIFIIGLVVGSFLNVVILRTVSGESIAFPGSKCPKCQTPLKWYHNIPVLSYIFLRGKCAFCKEHISIQYPIVELLTGILFTLFGFIYLILPLYTQYGFNMLYLYMFIFSLIAVSLFIVISGTDIKEMMVADKHTFSLIGTGIVYSIVVGGLSFYNEYKYGIVKIMLLLTPILFTVLSTIISFIFMEILRRGCALILKTDTFGDGDSYIFAGVCAVVISLFGGYNFIYVLFTLLCLFILSVLISVILTLPVFIKDLFIQKKYYLLGLTTAFIIFATGYFYGGNNGYLDNTIVLVTCTIVLLVLAVLLCTELLKGIKNKKETGSMIPFGPSLVSAGLIALIIMPFLFKIINLQ